MTATHENVAKQVQLVTQLIESSQRRAGRAVQIGETVRHDSVGSPTPSETVKLDSLSQISLAAPASKAPIATELQVVGVLGEGGTARVHLAKQASLDRMVAVKVLKNGTPASIAALLTEAKTTGLVDHPGIVPVYALARDPNNNPVLVMKRVEGVSWQALLDNPSHPGWVPLKLHDEAGENPPNLTINLEILMQVSNALAFAHRRGIVHLDIKPANIMVGEFGEVYLLDWGIAQLIQTSAAPPPEDGEEPAAQGTPAYMAPEMILPERGLLDARTDVYLLGATLHQVLTGQPRHAGTSLFDVLLAAADSNPFDYGSGIPQELGAIANTATHVDQSRRYPSALLFRHALADFLRHKASHRLALAALKRLRDVQQALHDRRNGKAIEASTLQSLLTESRFGFTQALREWSGNTEARTGLTACIELMIQQHIDDGAALAARSLLAELPERNLDLEKRIEELERQKAEAKEREARLAKIDHESDLSVGTRTRTALLLVIASSGIGGFFFDPGVLTIANLILGNIIGLSLITALSFAFRKHLMKNEVNRRIVAIILLTFGALLVERLIALNLGTPVRAVLITDTTIVMATIAATAVFLGRPRLFALVGLLLATVALCLLRPELAFRVIMVVQPVLTISMALLLFPARRKAPA